MGAFGGGGIRDKESPWTTFLRFSFFLPLPRPSFFSEDEKIALLLPPPLFALLLYS